MIKVGKKKIKSTQREYYILRLKTNGTQSELKDHIDRYRVKYPWGFQFRTTALLNPMEYRIVAGEKDYRRIEWRASKLR